MNNWEDLAPGKLYHIGGEWYGIDGSGKHTPVVPIASEKEVVFLISVVIDGPFEDALFVNATVLTKDERVVVVPIPCYRIAEWQEFNEDPTDDSR